MSKDTNATTREHTPHENRTTRTATIIDALKRRAQAILNDDSIDAQSRAIIHHGLETNDPWLAELVRHSGTEKDVGGTFDFSQTAERDEVDSILETDEVHSILETDRVDSKPETDDEDSSRKRIEALAEIICNAGDESAGALFVLMGSIQSSSDPKALAHTVKHFAFTRCGELNLFGMVDAQVASIEGELLANKSVMS
jgi:hypothetical protein